MFLVNKSPPSFFLGGLSYCLKIALDSYFELMIYTHFYTQMLWKYIEMRVALLIHNFKKCRNHAVLRAFMERHRDMKIGSQITIPNFIVSFSPLFSRKKVAEWRFNLAIFRTFFNYKLFDGWFTHLFTRFLLLQIGAQLERGSHRSHGRICPSWSWYWHDPAASATPWAASRARLPV